MANQPDFEDAPEVLAETENYAVVLSENEEGERIYNVDLDSVTLHLFLEEWTELVELIRDATRQ
jgi:hypothetical protein